MFLTICMSNQVAIQYAFAQDMLEEEAVIEDAVRGYLGTQGLCCGCIEALLDEFMTPQVKLKQREDGFLFVDLDSELIKV